jgi:hypothetical protein
VRRVLRVALIATLGLALTGCGTSEPTETAGVHLLTGEITGMAGACYADVAAHKTLLSIDPMDGTAMFDGEQLIPVMWPVGYTARLAGEQVQVLDASGEVIATTGRFYALIGRFHAGFFQTCMRTMPDEIGP